jgi:crotonobetainyl-CoA:carnitine CoA-transferase CaiB-like acyl-CoA transferase
MMLDPQALAGLRVVEFTQGMAGPWIGRLLAWCGAEVIRVESHKVPGVVRLYVPPRSPELGVQPALSPWFTDWDAGKLFVAVDLTRDAGVDLAKRWAARAEIVVENHRAGAMAKLGLGPNVLMGGRSDLILLSSSGFGDGGPHSDYVTWGPNIEAMSGLAGLSGFAERECAISQYAYPDSLSALHGLFAILCALDHRDRTGEGQHISLAQLETTVAMIGPAMMQQLAGSEPPRLGNASRVQAPHGCYRCLGDDRWCVVSVADDAMWLRLCNVIERPDLAADLRLQDLAGRLAHTNEIDAAIEAWTAERPPHEALERLQAARVAAGAVQNTEDQFQHDTHLAERGYFETIPHLVKGEVVACGIPLGLTATPGHTSRTGAVVGEDNEHVFRDLLGLSADEYADAVQNGAIEVGQAS